MWSCGVHRLFGNAILAMLSSLLLSVCPNQFSFSVLTRFFTATLYVRLTPTIHLSAEIRSSPPMGRKLFPVPVPVLLLYLAVTGCASAAAMAETKCEPTTTDFAATNRSLKIGVIVPRANLFPWSLPLAGPGISYAVETVRSRADDFLRPVSNMSVVWGDSRCSDTYGPLVAFDMYVNESVDAFVGPGCDYAVAPIARFARFWNRPVITGGALVHAFSDKSDYALLTRISGSYDKLGEAIVSLFVAHNWTVAGMIYHNNLENRRLGKTTEFFIMEGIYIALLPKFKRSYPDRNFYQGAFDGNTRHREMFFNIEALLKDASNGTRSELSSHLLYLL